jgi:endogenous inhibitor of DNA gyrase (YacG/DUF329 family)
MLYERSVLHVLQVADVPAEYQDAITTAGVTVKIVTQRTGFGQRRYFLCPTCGRKCGKLHRITIGEKTYKPFFCQKCIPLDLYKSRRNMYDEDSHSLIVWHMNKLAATVIDRPIKYPYCLIDYLTDKPPPGMSWRRYYNTLEKLQRMERLRMAAIFHGMKFTAREIKEYTKEW